jgi:hypothetical protein
MTRKVCSGSFKLTGPSDTISHDRYDASKLCVGHVVSDWVPRKRHRPGGDTPRRKRESRPHHGPPTLCFGILFATFLLIAFKQF